MSDDVEPQEANPDASFGKAVGRSIAIGLPVGSVVFVGLMWVVTGDLAEGFSSGILPGVLFGVFAGGFVGTVIGMRSLH